MASLDHDILEHDDAERAAEKQASRESDLARLSSGEVDRSALRAENSFFAPLKLAELRISAIGGVSIKSGR